MTTPDNHPNRLRISYGPRMIFAETVDSHTITHGADGTFKLEVTYTPPQPEPDAADSTEHDDAPPGWGDDNPGYSTDL
jgi:hypothetical protein